MSFTIGLVGKPSAGKSTFFKAATLAEVDIASYPFTTIKPNVGTGYVRIACADKFFGVQCNPRFGFCLDHTRFIPVEIIDVAGLVPGAHEGKGLGNQFLSDLNQADVLIHVVDASGSSNEKGEDIGVGNHDPAKDVRFLENEIDLWYASILWANWRKLARSTNMKNVTIGEVIADQLSAMKVTETIALKAIDDSDLGSNPENWSEDDIKKLSTAIRKNTKPILVALNKIDVVGASENIIKLKQEFPDTMFIPCSAELELALREAAKKEIISYVPGNNDFEILKKDVLSEKQLQGLEFIQKMLDKNGSTGVQQILDSAVFDFLKYIAVFPGGINNLSDSKGNILPDCFLMPPESTAKDFAYAIHTDFGKHFLYAMDVKKKIRISGDHELNHGDVVEIINAAK